MHLSQRCLSYDITFSKPLSQSSEKKNDSLLFVWKNPDELIAFEDFYEYIGSVTEKEIWRNELQTHFSVFREYSFSGDRCYIGELTEGVGFIVSARYHGIVAAIQRGIPCIGFDLCPKIRSIMRECGIEDFCIKLNEIGKIRPLLKRAQQHKKNIVSLQQGYSERATASILKSIDTANQVISQHLEAGEWPISCNFDSYQRCVVI